MKFEKLGNIAKITSGGTPLTSRREYYDNGTIPWVKTGDLKVRHLKNIPDKITQAGLENSSAKIFPVNTVLVAMYGATIGACSILKTEAATNQACAAILPNEKLNEEYLYFFLSSIRNLLINKGVGGGQPNISATILKDIKIPVPPKPLQLQIANLLSKSEDLIKQRKESIELLDKFLESTFYEMFGDPVRNENNWDLDFFEKLVAEDCPLTYGIVQPGEDFPNGSPIVRPVDLTETYVKRKGLKLIDPKISDKFKRTVLKGFEILMCVRGTTGVVAIASKELEGCNVTRGIVPIWFSENYNSLFAYYLLKSTGVQKEIQKLTYGATLQQINLSDLRRIKLIKPSLPVQEKFAAIAQNITNLKEYYKESLNELENLFGSLNQQAFKGELEFKNIPQKEIGDPLEGMDLPKDKLPGLDDILKQAGDKAEVVTEEKKTDKPKDKSTTGSPFENISTVTGSISNYKPVVEDVQPFIQKTFRDNYFSFENLKQATVKAGWQYDFEKLKNFVFELLRKGQLKQVFADAAFKSSFKESDADFNKIKELNEQMYLQQAATL